MNIFISTYNPHVCTLTEIGKTAVNTKPCFPNYYIIMQEGTNAFGGVAIIIHKTIKYKEIMKDSNFILVELETTPEPSLIGAVYVSPGKNPPFHVFTKCRNKPFYIFGDFNAKHPEWGCEIANSSGNLIVTWLELTGTEMIIPDSPTSRRSSAIIDFGITHDNTGWTSEAIDEGTSDHLPILIQSPLSVSSLSVFRSTNWNIFNFLLKTVYEYWLSLVYNYNEQFFFTHFSDFLTCLWDRSSSYKSVKKYWPPWPPYLVEIAREVSKSRRKYRRNKTKMNLESFFESKSIFYRERVNSLRQKCDEKMEWISKDQNIWKFARPKFHSYSPPFRSLNMNSKKVTDEREIVEILANYYEKHFAEPIPDENNREQGRCISTYEQIAYLSNIPLETITTNEVIMEWKKMKPTKSTDSVDTSAFLLKKLPIEYMNIITILFNKRSLKGEFFLAAKHAKIVCIPKEGIYPTSQRLRPISLLPNLGKWVERIIHNRIIIWYNNNNIYTDEQSGFSANRRLQTRIISLIEEVRLTVAANNRPGLAIFVDFLSAFDNMWIPSLINNLYELNMPLGLLKWVFNWLKDRSFSIYYGNERSRIVQMKKGAPQGSVMAATLFRIHIHFLQSYFNNIAIHLFADDLAIILTGSLEKKFSENIFELEEKTEIVLKQLQTFSEDIMLPVNVAKTKAILIHTIVAPPYPKLFYQSQSIEYVTRFRYLGVYILAKIGRDHYINERFKIIRKIYSAMRIIFRTIRKQDIKIRRKIFLAYALPHFIWLSTTWFFFTDNQKERIQHVYGTGVRIVYNLGQWDDLTTIIVAREKTLLDYIYTYWSKLIKHLLNSPEALSFQQTSNAYWIITSPDTSWLKTMEFRRNSTFLCRLIKQAKNCLIDWIEFENIHSKQHDYFKDSTHMLNSFILKYMFTS